MHEGDLVQVTMINGEGAEHDRVFPDFRVGSPGSFTYFCSLPGHREAGMEGLLKVEVVPTGPCGV